MARFKSFIEHLPKAEEHMENLSMMREYSFCKSHAISYSYLVWALAYWKARTPKRFWYAALKHCHSMYARWVHVNEAKKAGLRFVTVGPHWLMKEDTLYNTARTPFLFSDEYAEYKRYGYWLSDQFMPGCTSVRLGNKIRIRGLVATYRYYRGSDKILTFATIGTSLNGYWDVVIEKKLRLHDQDIIDVEGEIKTFFGSRYVSITEIYSSQQTIESLSLKQRALRFK
ncbi:MAG: hypothetical protein KC505_09075 [Myxococcales bacterium]|nr:hypothetical protein [Myxococcales bacterium]